MKILAFTDPHHPWSNKYKLTKLYELIGYERPDVVLCLGDDYDLFNFGGYPRNPNIIMPEKELIKGHEHNERMWNSIRKVSPMSKKFRIDGNHNSRIVNQTIRKAPELLSLVNDSNLYDFKEVENIEDRGFIEIENVIYCHGWSTKPVTHRNHFNKSVVNGHSHRAELRVDLNHKTNHTPFFAVSAGCLINFNAPVFDYTASKHTNWRHAACIVEHGTPRLVLL